MLGHLALGQAIALPVTEESGGELKLFTIGQRLTPHVRHRQKYVDVPVTEAVRFSSRRTASRRVAFAPCGSSWTRSNRRRLLTATCGAETSRDGLPTCLAITRLRRTAGARSRVPHDPDDGDRARGRRGHPGPVRARNLRVDRLPRMLH